MKNFHRVALFLGFLFYASDLAFLAVASPHTPAFSGHYELADAKADRVFSLDVTQTGAKADISFSAAMTDGSGAAPDGDGKGEIKSTGALSFTFKDSFDNEGTGTFKKGKDGYHLDMHATKVTEPRCLRFYGDIVLKKTSGKPQPN